MGRYGRAESFLIETTELAYLKTLSHSLQTTTEIAMPSEKKAHDSLKDGGFNSFSFRPGLSISCLWSVSSRSFLFV